jgi:hypothetical protein
VTATRLFGLRPRLVVDGRGPRGGRMRPRRQPPVIWAPRSGLTAARTFCESTCSCSTCSPRPASQVLEKKWASMRPATALQDPR